MYSLLLSLFTILPGATPNLDLAVARGANPPVVVMPASPFVLSSPFGPRLKASDGFRYDFHRGIDIPGTVGQAVSAIAAGTIEQVYPEGSSTFPNGGNSVIIRHTLSEPIAFHGVMVDRYFSLYLHLDTFGPAATQFLAGVDPVTISAGELVGGMGQSGTTDFVHLHFEIRLATVCSLEWQLAHPDSACAGHGFDPHINFMGWTATPVSTSFGLTLEAAGLRKVRARITAPPDMLVVDGLTLTAREPGGSAILYQDTLSFNQRSGFDATSNASLDLPQQARYTMAPAAYNVQTTLYEINIDGVIPDHVWQNHDEIAIEAGLLTTGGTVKAATVTLNCAVPVSTWRDPLVVPIGDGDGDNKVTVRDFVGNLGCLR